MTRPRARKSARSLRWFSAGCPSARSIIQVPTQIEQESSPVHAGSLLLTSRFASAGAPDQLAFAQGRHLRRSNPHSA